MSRLATAESIRSTYAIDAPQPQTKWNGRTFTTKVICSNYGTVTSHGAKRKPAVIQQVPFQDSDVKSKLFIGIDPGKSGAIGFYAREECAAVSVVPMPVLPTGRGRIMKYDLNKIAKLLARTTTFPDAYCCIEEQHPRPREGVRSAWSSGFGVGILLMACECFGIPVHLVSPRRWQTVMLPSARPKQSKAESILQAKIRFPGVCLRRTERSRKDDDNMADALLLAAYGALQPDSAWEPGG